jgi:hypothetical protein
VTITARDFQATALTPPGTAPQAQASPPTTDVDRIGIVFVHGIGTQQPAETFLDWSKPIVRLLTAWRDEQSLSPDPVISSQFAFSAASQPYLELDIPKVGAHPARRFVITEAWWAAQVRPPSLSDAAGYMFRGFPKILRGIVRSYETRGDVWSKRLDRDLAAAEADGRDTPAIRELKARGRWRWIDVLDGVQRFVAIVAYVPALAIGGLFLLLYAPFRLIPIQAIQDAAALKSVDNFMTTWFGDLPDILDDPVQAANVRSRLAESIDRLVTQQGCGSIAIVAHSGGAIVSFTTLLDPLYQKDGAKPFTVQRLITIGEALALGWRLDATGTAQARGSSDRLTGDLVAARPELQWTDVWASYDPAPAGPIEPAPPGVKVPAIDSRPVTNRMSILEDHGAYWENDEGFVIPLVRILDEIRGSAEDSRFFSDSTERAVRIERRRQRVGVLALWRWIVVLGALVPIAGSTLAWALTGGAVAGPAGLGRAVGIWFETVPFHQLVTAPLAFVSGITELPTWFEALGQWFVGSLTVALAFLAIGLIGGRFWAGWDERERAIARREPLAPVHRRDVAVVSAGLAIVVMLASAWFMLQAWT